MQPCPTFCAPGASFMEDGFFINWGRRDGFWMIKAHHNDCALLFLLLHQLHLRSSGFRSQRLGTPATHRVVMKFQQGKAVRALAQCLAQEPPVTWLCPTGTLWNGRCLTARLQHDLWVEVGVLKALAASLRPHGGELECVQSPSFHADGGSQLRGGHAQHQVLTEGSLKARCQV